MFRTAPRAHFRDGGPAVLLAAAACLSLARCAVGPGSTASPTKSIGMTTTGTPATGRADMAITGPEQVPERTSEEIVSDLLAIVRDLTAYSPGAYTYFDETPFDPNDTSGYVSQSCLGQKGKSIDVLVAGPPVADMEVVERMVVDAYTARGWEVILRAENELPEGKIMDVAFADRTGKQFSFGVGPAATTITVSSECSWHPSLDEPST
jgi:hypothetical protein